MSQIYSYTPHRLKFLKPVTVMLPYFAHGVPSHSSEGSEQLMFMRATDARGLDWRAQGGAVFQDGVGYLQTEALGLFGIFAGPEVTAVGPPEASSRGGDTLEVRGTEVAHCFASPASLCQLGTAPLQYAVAQVVTRGEEPGRVLCQLPALPPGFVSLELLNPERFVVSESGVQFLSREPAVSLHAFPDHASVHVPSLAFIGGRHLHSAAGLHRCRFRGENSSRPGGSRPEVESPRRITRSSSAASPHCVSSAICVFETPVGPNFVSTHLSDSGRKTSSLSLGAGEPSGKPLRFGLLDVPPVATAGGRGMEYSGGDVRVRFTGRQALPGIVDGMFECRIGTTGSAARRVGMASGELACFAPLMPPGDHGVAVSLHQAVLQAAAGLYTSAPALPSFGQAPESLLEPPVAGGIELTAEPQPPGTFAAQLSPAQLSCSLGAADTLATPLMEAPSSERLWRCDLPRAAPGFHALVLSELSASGPPLRQAAFSLAVRVKPELERIEPRVAYEGDVRRVYGKSLAAGNAAFRISDLRTEWFEDLPGHWVSSALAYVFVLTPPGIFTGPAASRSVRGVVIPGGGDAAEAVTVTSIAPGPACDEEPEALGAGGSRYGDVFHSALGGGAVIADVAHEEMDARCSLRPKGRRRTWRCSCSALTVCSASFPPTPPAGRPSPCTAGRARVGFPRAAVAEFLPCASRTSPSAPWRPAPEALEAHKSSQCKSTLLGRATGRRLRRRRISSAASCSAVWKGSRAGSRPRYARMPPTPRPPPLLYPGPGRALSQGRASFRVCRLCGSRHST